MARQRISVMEESKTGRNLKFRDNYRNRIMNLRQFVTEIEAGNYNNFHIRKLNGVKTPVSNPDKTSRNNLG